MNYKRLFIDNSLIFITMVTNNRNPILFDNFDLIKQAYYSVSEFYKFELLAYTVLKDHIHCIIKPEKIKDYPKIIKSFKYSFTKNVGIVIPTYNLGNIDQIYESDKQKNKIWQNRYWAHVILQENDLYKHLDYIHYNSFKHYNIVPKEWKYSSFKTFVLNGMYDIDWCNIEDKNNILDMNFE